MKIKQLLLVSTMYLLASFQSVVPKLNMIENTSDIASQVKSNPTDASKIMIGTWVGEMNGKQLTVVITNVVGSTITGYNILGNTRRALSGYFQIGTWDQPCSKAYDVTLSEPGTDKWDGVFTIKFVGYTNTDEEGSNCVGPYSGVEASGSWKANNGKLAHEFQLEKK